MTAALVVFTSALVRECQIKTFGIDIASIDYGQSTAFETQGTLRSCNVPASENLAGYKTYHHARLR